MQVNTENFADGETNWADVSSVLTRMRTLTVKAGRREYRGAATLDIDDQGNVMLTFKTAQETGLKRLVGGGRQ